MTRPLRALILGATWTAYLMSNSQSRGMPRVRGALADHAAAKYLVRVRLESSKIVGLVISITQDCGPDHTVKVVIQAEMLDKGARYRTVD